MTPSFAQLPIELISACFAGSFKNRQVCRAFKDTIHVTKVKVNLQGDCQLCTSVELIKNHLGTLDNVSEVIISNCRVFDFEPLANFTNMRKLHIYGNYFHRSSPEALDFLARLPNLEELRLSLPGSSIPLKPLSFLTNLRKLEIVEYSWTEFLSSEFMEAMQSRFEHLEELSTKHTTIGLWGAKQLVALLGSNMSVSVQEWAATELADMGEYDIDIFLPPPHYSRSCLAIVDAGGVTSLLALLRSESVGVQEQAARALRMLCDDTAFPYEIVIPPLAALLQSESVDVQEQAVGALANLAFDDENRAAIAEAVGAPLMALLLKSKSVGVQKQTMHLLHALITNGYMAEIVNNGGIRQLVALMNSVNKNIKMNDEKNYKNYIQIADYAQMVLMKLLPRNAVAIAAELMLLL